VPHSAASPLADARGAPGRGVLPLVAALVLLAAVLLATGALAVPAAAAPDAPTPSPTTAAPRPSAVAGEDPPVVVLLGASGLRWDDISPTATPALWELAGAASVGENAVRSVRRLACPADGWLAVSAGKRAADLPGEDGRCRTLDEPIAGQVPAWDDYEAAAEEATYGARLGTLGQAVEDAGLTAVGVGPGAAIALANLDGVVVGEHLTLPPEAVELTGAVGAALADGARLVVVDAGTVRDPGKATTSRPLGTPGEIAEEPTRAEQVQAVEERVAAALAGVADAGRPATVFVTSLADSGAAPRLQLIAATGPGVAPGAEHFGDSLLGSRSTRQDGIVQNTDITPSVLAAFDLARTVPPGTLVGSPIEAVAAGAAGLAAVLDIGRHAVAIQPLIPPFFLALVFINLVFYLLVAIGLNGWVVARLRTRAPVEPRTVLKSLSVAGVSIASIPVASYVANAIPWWRTGAPGWTLFGLVVVIIGAITVLTLLPPWGRTATAPIAVVAGLTMAVLLYDGATGGTLQVSALMGAPPTVAGRFYGLNNQAFALLATSSLLVAVVASDPFVKAGRRRAAAAVIAGIGLVVTVVDGMPGLGSDFGGPPSLVPAFTIFVLLALGVRLTWARVLAVLAAGAAVVVALSLIDWLRPESQRTHLGRFVDTVLDGGLWDVITRKLDQNLSNLGGTWLTLLALGGIALVVLVLARPIRLVANAPDGGPYSWLSGGAPLRLIGDASPMLGAGLTSIGVVLALGFAANDSGIVIPAIGVSLAVPLLVAVCATWMLELRWAEQPSVSGAPGRSPGPAGGA
jgi:hypothetical protein